MRQKITFYSDSKSSIHDFPELDRYEWNDIHNEMNLEANLVIPLCPATMIGFSRLVKIKYYVIVDGYVTGCHMFPFIMFPITVGTFPLSDEVAQIGKFIILYLLLAGV